MKRIGFITGSFDPVTSAEIKQIRGLLKTEHLDVIYLQAEGDGVLSYQVRMKLLRQAVRPFRRLKAAYPHTVCDYETQMYDPEGEERVRHGYFTEAAVGIRRTLIEKGYYLSEIVNYHCKPKRAAHSVSVADVCRKLAEAHGMDSEQAWRAGMLHDITKKWNDEESERIVRIYYPEMLSYSPKVWHSYTAPVFLYREMGLRDQKILHAIECHTIGNGTGKLDHILYIADKCEPLRGYDCSYQLALSRQDLAAGAAYVLEESRRYILEKEGVHV